ncbi:DNA gyrase inhibitor YacG [Sinimarinibacterium sp. HSW-8]|uniref:DNA gyrase inhibitor YacG n=1 Tax=Sinimarinibacterium thermocellulolyticum TaxID=3170016 RepID=A0ABV2AAT3_9GAMM
MAACPHCGRSARLDASNPWRPFCSERCKLIDLGAWFSEARSIPVGEASDPLLSPTQQMAEDRES